MLPLYLLISRAFDGNFSNVNKNTLHSLKGDVKGLLIGKGSKNTP